MYFLFTFLSTTEEIEKIAMEQKKKVAENVENWLVIIEYIIRYNKYKN